MRASISKLHRTLMFVSLIVPQTESSLKVESQRPALIIMGDDGQGGRYYGKVATDNSVLRSIDRESYKTDGYTCIRRDSVVKPYDGKLTGNDRMWGYTVNNENGFPEMMLMSNIGGLDTPFLPQGGHEATFQLSRTNRESTVIHGPLRPDLMLESFNSLYNSGTLHFLETAEYKPAANSVYYGFSSDGFDIKINTDKNGKIKSVKTHGTDEFGYNVLMYTMYGKAMMVTLLNENAQRKIMTEPVNKDKFDGTKESFAAARLDTVEGAPLQKGQLSQLLDELKSKLKGEGGFTSDEPSLNTPKVQEGSGKKETLRRGSLVRSIRKKFHSSKSRKGDKDGEKQRLLKDNDD